MQKLTLKMLDEMVEKELQEPKSGRGVLNKLMEIAKGKRAETETGEVK